ncbi:MAG: response regulator [Elusimicrobiota bacterium]
MPEKTYTTHDIGRFCDVYPSSVANWINSGKIKSYQTPGGHHRVSRKNLLDFLAELNIPIPAELKGRARVLIVDDDEEMARVIAKAFSRRADEFETEVCGDGIEALIRIGQEPPDLIILDIVLPKMDGIQVCRVLKAKPETRDIKIVAMTGKKLPSSEKMLEEVRVDALFRKPLDLVELVLKSAELLRLNAISGVRK